MVITDIKKSSCLRTGGLFNNFYFIYLFIFSLPKMNPIFILKEK